MTNSQTSPSFGNSRKKRVVLIVDPFSSVQFLVDNLITRGKHLLCLKTHEVETTQRHGFSETKFCEVIDYRDHDSDVLKLEMYLKPRYSVECVIPGVEESVLKTDVIAYHLKMKIQNNYLLSICRKDKYAMHMRLRDCGLRYIHQKECRTCSDVLDFARVVGFPCVCKPPRASGTKGVYKCFNETDVVVAATSIFSSSDVTLCQEHIVGVEYVCDMVSCQGMHLPSIIYRYEKNSESQGFAYVNTMAVKFDNDPNSLTSKLYSYVKAVLNVLGIQNGPSHAEVFMTEDGPCLVEVGARMHGILGPYVTEKIASLECSQHFLAADVYVNRAKHLKKKYKNWTQRCKEGILPYDIKKFAIWHDLQVSQTMGVLARDIQETAEPLLSSLQTAMKTYYHMYKNQKLRKTRDMATSPGGVVLIGDEKQVQKDYKQVLEWERSGMLWDVRKTSRVDLNNILRYTCVNPESEGDSECTHDTHDTDVDR